jgi:hypothetical protein
MKMDSQKPNRNFVCRGQLSNCTPTGRENHPSCPAEPSSEQEIERIQPFVFPDVSADRFMSIRILLWSADIKQFPE